MFCIATQKPVLTTCQPGNSSFNLGVEPGQFVVLALLIPALDLLFRYGAIDRLGVIIAAAIAADISGHWIAERWNNFSRYRISWPEFNASS